MSDDLDYDHQLEVPTDMPLPDEVGETWGSKWLPTPKWVVAMIVGVTGLIAAYIQAGEWNDTLSITLTFFLGARAAAYVAANSRS